MFSTKKVGLTCAVILAGGGALYEGIRRSTATSSVPDTEPTPRPRTDDQGDLSKVSVPGSALPQEGQRSESESRYWPPIFGGEGAAPLPERVGPIDSQPPFHSRARWMPSQRQLPSSEGIEDRFEEAPVPDSYSAARDAGLASLKDEISVCDNILRIVSDYEVGLMIEGPDGPFNALASVATLNLTRELLGAAAFKELFEPILSGSDAREIPVTLRYHLQGLLNDDSSIAPPNEAELAMIQALTPPTAPDVEDGETELLHAYMEIPKGQEEEQHDPRAVKRIEYLEKLREWVKAQSISELPAFSSDDLASFDNMWSAEPNSMARRLLIGWMQSRVYSRSTSLDVLAEASRLLETKLEALKSQHPTDTKTIITLHSSALLLRARHSGRLAFSDRAPLDAD